MKWASTIATPARLEDAAAEAAEALAAELGGEDVDLLFAFASQEYSDHFVRLPECLRERFPNALLLGCSAGGVIGGGREVEGEAGLALTGACLPDVRIEPFHLGSDPERWLGEANVEANEPELIVLPEPFSTNTDDLVNWLDTSFPESVKIGGLASGADQPGGNVLFLGDEIHRTGTVGVALSGNLEVDTIVAQGCRPIGSPMFVTRAEEGVLYELDGRPAMSILESLYTQLPTEDQDLFRSSLFLGVVMREEQEVYEHGDFLIRNLVGVDPSAGALAVAANLRPNQVVQFHLRDAHASADDLEAMLSRHRYGSPAGALLFSCLGRGRLLYGEPDHDSRVFHEQIGKIPLGGFFCNGEIGPVLGQTFLHGYTSSFGLFRPKKP